MENTQNPNPALVTITDMLGFELPSIKKQEKTQQEKKSVEKTLNREATRKRANVGRPRKTNDDYSDKELEKRKYYDFSTGLVTNRDLHEKLQAIADATGLSLKEIRDKAFRDFVSKYEKKYGEVVPRASKSSADDLF